jgi:hypothetical protein
MIPRVFAPLPADHPLVGYLCPACRLPFQPWDNTLLRSLRDDVGGVPGIAVHASCALDGFRTAVGTTQRIEGVDKPVITERVRFTLEDAGLLG